MTEPWCKQEDRASSTVVRYGQKEGCNVLIGDVRRTDKRRPACSCLVTDALYAHIVHWWRILCVLCTGGRMKVLLHSTPAFFLFSQSVVRPCRLLKCEEAEAVVQHCSENLDSGFWCKYVAQTDRRDA